MHTQCNFCRGRFYFAIIILNYLHMFFQYFWIFGSSISCFTGHAQSFLFNNTPHCYNISWDYINISIKKNQILKEFFFSKNWTEKYFLLSRQLSIPSAISDMKYEILLKSQFTEFLQFSLPSTEHSITERQFYQTR